MLKNALATCVICLVLFAASLHAQAQQDVFAVPGANSTATNVAVFSSNPFSNITGFSAGAGTFLVLAKPDGSKFFAIANSGSSTVTAVPNSFASPQSLASLGTQATAAVMSEDGKRLAVAAGLLHIFDTTSGADLVPNGISIGAAVTVFDVAASLDGTTFYALGSNTSGGSVLAAVNASSFVVTSTLPITGPSIAVAVGPNGLIYVSAPNQILEINPNTFTVTSGGAILVNAKPGKLVFTPDGLNALAVNQTPITGSAVLQIGLSSHAVVNSVPNFGVLLNQLQVLNSTNVLAYSSQNQSLYEITLTSNGSLSINGYALPGIGTSTVQGFVLSSEVPSATRSTPQSLYVAANGIIYREDLPSTTVTGQFPLSVTPGGLSFAGAAFTGTPATLLQYGNNQTIAPNAVSLPVVVRVLDNNGDALSGVAVTFASNNGAASISPASVTTGSDGYAVTYVTAPAASGPLTVTASAGSQTAAYTMTVGSGGGGPTTGGISIVAGQGQIVFENNNTGIPGFGSPLIVQVNNTSGVPIPGASVTFALTQGPGSVTASGSQPGTVPNSIIVTTGNNGQASADFLSSTIGQNGLGYASTTITASAAGAGSVNFYMTTVPQGSAAQIRLITPAPGSGAVLSGPAGATLPAAVVVGVASIDGVAIPNVGITIGGGTGTNAPNATCNNPTGNGVLTDATGTATCDLVLNGVEGTGTFYANVGYFQNTANFLIQITAGPPGVVRIVQGNNQSGAPGQKLQTALVVQITDAFGNILSGVPVTWSILNPGAVTLSSIIASSDSNGEASALATLGSIAGTAQVKVTAGSVSATFTLTVNIPSAGISKVSGDAQATLIGTAFPAPLVVSVVDANGNPVQGATVTWTVTGGATLGSTSTTTGANGQASTTVTAGPNAGAVVVTAATATFSVNFNLTAQPHAPSNVTFVNAASFVQDSVSPGAIVIISGTGIATGVQGLVSAYNIIGEPQPSLAGISVTFNGVTAPIYYVSTTAGQPDQVAVQVPFETQPGPASVVINPAAGGPATVTEQVSQYAPGIFQTTIGGQLIAVAVRSDGSYVSPSNPAQQGENIQVFVTGLGQVSPATATGSAGVPGQSVVGNVVVGLNNGGVPLISALYAQGMVGVYIITLQVPVGTQTGPAQPLGVVAFDAAGNPYFAQGSVIPIQ
jgi:uncharacterized protein (TIGR03437 family)